MAKQCIGLDIGSRSVKAVQLKRKGTGWALQAFGMQPLVPQTIVDGTIMDQGAVADAIRQLWRRLKLQPEGRRDRDRGSLGDHQEDRGAADDAPSSSRRTSATRPSTTSRSAGMTSRSTTTSRTRRTRAARPSCCSSPRRRKSSSDYVQVVRDANLSPQVVDVAAFASQNGFEANYPLDPRETVVLINIGAAISNINIVRSGVSLFTRDVTIGGNAFTEEIQKQLGIAADEAEAYKVGGTPDRGRRRAAGSAPRDGGRRPR